MFYFGFAKVRRFFLFHSLYQKGITRENLGEYPKALNLLFLALSLNANSLKTYIAITRVNRKNKTFLNAIDFCTKAINRFPKKAQLYAIRADIYRRIKEYNNAINSYNKAIELDSSNSEYYTQRAKIKYLTNDIQGAINDMNGAILNNKKESKLYAQRGFYQFEKKNYQSAKEDYSQAISLCPNKAHLQYMRDCCEKLLTGNDFVIKEI